MIRAFMLATFAAACGAVALAAAHAAPAAAVTSAATPIPVSSDPYLWLENVSSPRSMAWVNAENAKTLRILTGDSHYPALYRDALAVAQTKDRIAEPEFYAGRIYNFWQDAQHVRGIWRSTTLTDYDRAQPHWKTTLDIDRLATREKTNWVWEGAQCLRPTDERCLVHLSNGGEDAQTLREYDRTRAAFVPGGFVLSRGKQDAVWVNRDTLLVSRAWQPGQLTTSGYPYVVKRLRRGQPLSAAVEVFRGAPTDTRAYAQRLDDAHGNHLELVARNVSFFQMQEFVLDARGTRRIAMPLKHNLLGMIDGRMLVSIAEPWHAVNGSFRAGSLVALDASALRADPAHPRPQLIYAPGPRDSLGGVSVARDHLLVTTYHNVRGRAFIATPGAAGAWSMRALDVPDNSSIDAGDADATGTTAFINVTGFLTPTTLRQIDTATGTQRIVKSLPAQFDASRDAVEQREATSSDGTKIPYFIVHPKNMTLDGANPTILYAYGGFEVSLTPQYSATLGKLWLERGGTFVLANIRGGGEFGPAWHEAGMTVHRQRIYDDFVAVARKLIADRVTSPAHLGIQGGSNGGLLMGVQFTQHPELWKAVDIQVPLLDMLRFEHIAAGASWVGEYGSTGNPAQRRFLASISPYNNVHPGRVYPQPLIWTTTKDDRVGPQHARKFAARLAEFKIPYLFYEVTEGGHGAGANLKERAKTEALEMTYFTRKLMTDGG